jgi:surface protein
MRKIFSGRKAGEGDFIFAVDTGKTDANSSNSDQFCIPIKDGTSRGGYTVAFNVDWGDGTTSQINSSNYATERLHTYAGGAGTYTITCGGSIAGFSFGAMPSIAGIKDSTKLMDIMNWGSFHLGDTPASISLGQVFYNCSNLVQVSAPDVPNTRAANGYLEANAYRQLFHGCGDLERINNIGNWYTNGESFTCFRMFNSCVKFQYGDMATGIIDLSGWDMTSVSGNGYDMMFYDCKLFNGKLFSQVSPSGGSLENTFGGCEVFSGSNSITELQAWDTSNITVMNQTFKGCPLFNVDISMWNTSSVTNMLGMFDNYSTASPGVFNQPIGAWDTSNVTNMTYMLNECSSFDQDLSNWNVNAWSAAGSAPNALAIAASFAAPFVLSQANYNALLIAWDAYTYPSWPGGTVSFGSSQYSLSNAAAVAARASLVTKWGAITDGGGV